MRTAIYTRVSTDIQVEEGFSLDAQLHRLHAYSDSQGWTITGVYTDEGISAKDMNRPQLQRMLSDIERRKIDVVLVYRLDRLTRSVADLHKLLNIFDSCGVGFKSATEVYDTTNAMGRLFITIVAALAQWERENLGERVRFGQAEMVRQGRYFGHTAPYGYALDDGRLVVNEDEAPVIRIIFDRYLIGEGASKIVKHLNDPANHLPPPRGAPQWSARVVGRIVKNPVYCGYVRYGNKTRKTGSVHETILAKSEHAPIIEESEWKLAQRLMEERRVSPARSGTGMHPLVGVLRCSNCGSAMVGRIVSAGRSGRTNPYRGYMCNGRRNKHNCSMKMWKGEVLEEAVMNALALAANDVMREVVAEIHLPSVESEIEKMGHKLEHLKSERRKWLDAFRKDFISGEDLRDELGAIDGEMEYLNERMAARASPAYVITEEDVRNFRKSWEIASSTERSALIRAFVETAWVHADGTMELRLRTRF